MIRYALVCDQAHAFESWFARFGCLRQAGQTQAGRLPALRLDQGGKGDHGAAACDARKRREAPAETPPAAAPDKAAAAPVAMISPQEQELRSKLKELREHLTKNADNVGPKFPEEARKMHYGEIEHRSIYGEASPDDAKRLGRGRHRIPSAADAAGGYGTSRLLGRRVPGAAQHEVVRCRPGIVANSGFAKAPDQRRITSLRAAPHAGHE